MSDLDPLQAGRPVRLVPVAPGFWAVALGVSLAAIAPLFGFLIGVMTKAPDGEVLLSPIYLGLLVGVLIGGAGVALAVLGGFRLYRHANSARLAAEAEAPAQEAVA
ncbi:MAG: hypothetical protein Q4G35_13380 [Propionibacteriaceae bacterium]|nr:hypothetical protein [Propionibacteriaceae bacterium]